MHKFCRTLAITLIAALSLSTQAFAVDHMQFDEDYIPEQEVIEVDETYISEEDVKLLAMVTWAEAGCESEEGQRLVIDTVLNRVDSEYFPDTIYDVIHQPNQYTPVWDGRKVNVDEDIVELVREEAKSRMNSDIVFFRTKRYHSFGVPVFQVGAHYFSKYE